MDGKCHESCLGMVLNWLKIHLSINKDFIEDYSEDGDEVYFLEDDVQYPVNLQWFTMIYFFLQKTETWKVEKLVAYLHDKNIYYIH